MKRKTESGRAPRADTAKIETMRDATQAADAGAVRKLRGHEDEPGASGALEIIRKNQVSKYIPLGHTRLGDLIAAGLLETVPLTASGHAKGVTMRSIRKYQALVMGLKEVVEQDSGR